MKLSICCVAALMAVGISARASDSESVLRFLIDKSPLIVSATVTGNTGAIALENGIHEMWSIEVTGVEVLKGGAAAKGTMRVSIDRFGYFQDPTAKFAEEGQKVILFLKRNRPRSTPRWIGADRWFSLQTHSTMLAERIKRIVEGPP